jgi:two-component SAPR family response regulator
LYQSIITAVSALYHHFITTGEGMSMARLVISLLGPFQVTLDGNQVTSFGSDAARALLAYLAMHAGVSPRREVLAGLLWPDRPEVEAQHNLAQAYTHFAQPSATEAPMLHF